MGDFLSRLVERSAGRAPAAHAAVAPLFAPGPAVAAEPAPLEPDSVRFVPKDPAPVKASISKGPTPSLREPPAGDSDGPGRVPTLALPIVPPATLRELAPGPLRPAAAAPPEARPQGPAQEDRSPRAGAPPVMAPLTPAGVQVPGAVPGRLPVREERRGVDTEIRSVAMPLLRPREEVAPRWAEALRPSGAGDGSPAPIVRISIGRIEVRAVAPPAPAAPRDVPVRKSTGPSLEEYLRPRSPGR
jgi:hypothetical protein